MKEHSTVSFEGQDIFIGIDVHKNSWSITLQHCHCELAALTVNPSADELVKYLQKKCPGGRYHSAYEAGFSGFEAHRRLCELGVENIVVNPADVPTNGKERDYKSDRRDSRKLARCLESGYLDAVYVPSREQLRLRNLVRLETKQTGNITRTQNRIHGHFYFNGLQFRGWGGKFLELYRLEAEESGDYTLLSLLRTLRFEREEKLRIIQDERKILKELGREEIQKNLESIPGIGFRTAIVLHSELWEMERFGNKERLSSYVGTAPHVVGSGEHETVKSAGNRKQRKLHYLIVEAAWRALRGDMKLRAKYGALVHRGLSAQQAICAIAKRLLFTIRAVWMQNRPYMKPENA